MAAHDEIRDASDDHGPMDDHLGYSHKNDHNAQCGHAACRHLQSFVIKHGQLENTAFVDHSNLYILQ